MFSLICLGGLGSCMDKNVEVNLPSYVASDPNVEVVFTDYSPLEGAVRTNMFINGSNFGTDPSLIQWLSVVRKRRLLALPVHRFIVLFLPVRMEGLCRWIY